MSLQIPTSGLKEPTLRGARHHSAIYHIEAEKEQAEALKVQPVKVEAPVVQDYYKFYRKGIERVEKKTNQNENQLEPGTIHIRNVFSEKGTEADYSETDFSPTRLSTITKTTSKSSTDLTAISELTKKYFDCQKILVDVDDSLAYENAAKVSKLLQQRVHESFMKEFWALQYHYPKDRFKRVGDGIKKPPPSVNDFEPTLEMITARRKRTTVLAAPKHVETPVVKLPAVVEPVRRKKPVSPRKSLKSAKSIYNLLPQSENGIIDVKAMSKLTTSVNLNDKPFVGSAGKRALIPMIGLQRASVWYSEKSHKAQNAEVSTPKSRERSRKEIDADLHQEFQNQARNRMRIITNSVYQRELFSELPKCIRNHLDDVIAILKKPPHERKKIDIAMLKVYVKPLNAFSKMQSGVLFDQLCQSFTLHQYPKGHTIFKQGDYGDAWYILLYGRVDIRVANGVDLNNSTLVRILPAGEGFGEVALINSVPRGATVSTRTDAILLKVHKNDFRRISGFIHEFEQRKMFTFLRHYVPWFANLNEDEVYSVAEHALWREFSSKATIIDERQRVNQIFVIKSGVCEVYRFLGAENEKKRRVFVGNLYVGDHFNHQLLRDHENPIGCPFTVIAKDDVECATLVAVGDWIGLDLDMKVHPFGELTQHELMKIEATQICEKKFRKQQKRILELMIKEKTQDPNVKLETFTNQSANKKWKY